MKQDWYLKSLMKRTGALQIEDEQKAREKRDTIGEMKSNQIIKKVWHSLPPSK